MHLAGIVVQIILVRVPGNPSKPDLESCTSFLLLATFVLPLFPPSTRRAHRLHELEGGVEQLLAVLVPPLLLALTARRAVLCQPPFVGHRLGLVGVVPTKELGVRDRPEPAEAQLLSQLGVGRDPFLDFPRSATSLAC